jgi:hypothetical protein
LAPDVKREAEFQLDRAFASDIEAFKQQDTARFACSFVALRVQDQRPFVL